MGRVRQGIKLKYAKNKKAKYRVNFIKYSYRKVTPKGTKKYSFKKKTITSKKKRFTFRV